MGDGVDFEDYGEDYFRDVIRDLTEHQDWKYSQGNYHSVEEVVEEASGFRSEAHFQLDHTETDGTLRLNAADLTDPVGAIGGVLAQTLDNEQDYQPEPDSFGGRLTKAYQSIADENSTEYFEGKFSPIESANIQVPLEYDNGILQETLHAASETSKQLQELNDEIRRAVDSRI